MITEGITVNGLHSYRDFGLYIKSRTIGAPTKKMIRDTVPYMNGYYDFSALAGLPAWEERTLKYSFDIAEASVQRADAMRDQVLNWLANAHETVIQDDSMPDYHFIGSYDGSDVSEDGEGMELSFEFVCHPFKIANAETEIALTDGSQTLEYGGQATTAYITATESGSVTLNGTTQAFSANTRTELAAALEHGENTIALSCSGTARLTYTEAIL